MGKKIIKNAILGNVQNVDAIKIGDEYHFHVSSDSMTSKKQEFISKEIQTHINNESVGLIISEIRAKSDAGSWLSPDKYERHIQTISVVISNQSSKAIEGFKVKVEIPKNLAKYDPKAEIINNNRVFIVENNQKLYPDESIEIHCGETYIHYKDAEEAFNSDIKVIVLWDGGKTEFSQPIDGFLLGTTLYADRKILKLSDFVDKNDEIL